MRLKQGRRNARVLHCTVRLGTAPLSPPIISAAISEKPLAWYTEAELDGYFDGLIRLVLHEGREQ